VDSNTVFDAYVRGKNQVDRSGTGLGLAFVRMVAERHGGHAIARNRPEGGAQFQIALPDRPTDADEPFAEQAD
jgi:signal transduction histidine kinase